MTEEEKRRFFKRVDEMTDDEAIDLYKRLDERGKRGAKTAILSYWESMIAERMEEMRSGKWTN